MVKKLEASDRYSVASDRWPVAVEKVRIELKYGRGSLPVRRYGSTVRSEQLLSAISDCIPDDSAYYY